MSKQAAKEILDAIRHSNARFSSAITRSALFVSGDLQGG